jgi:hypothetical protein
VSIALREVQTEPKWERQESCSECDGDGCTMCDPTYQDYAACHEFEIAPDPTVANFDRLLRESYIKHQDTHSRAQDDPGATSTG